MDKIRISAVSYLNTAPYVYGLEHSRLSNRIEVSKDNPAECALKLSTGEADVGLVPVATLLAEDHWRPITSWGIAADGPVQSVLLVGEVPVDQMESIYLDYQSKTSNRLLQILCDELFEVIPDLRNSQPGYEEKINGKCGGLLIGDRALHAKAQFPFQYDLSGCWKELTDLPFVFARWVASGDLPKEVIGELDAAFQYGVDHIDFVVEEQKSKYPGINLMEYFGKHIHYRLDERYFRGMSTFMDKLVLVEQNW